MDYIHAAKQVTDQAEIDQIMEVALSTHYAGGAKADEFSKKLKKFLKVKNVVLCNSGSSANLLAMSAAKELYGLKDGDEVITTACGFPTTVNPIIQNGLIPVFIDVDLGTYVANLATVEAAIGERTKAIFMAHTLGNPFSEREVREMCDTYGMVLISDCCDALGATYEDRHVGTFSRFATLSHYPAHQLSCGEGGTVYGQSDWANVTVKSLAEWGRSCYCEPGKDNTCGKRFCWNYETLPYGFDHKYVYERIGYNLKMSDLNAAVGVAQMDKLEGFVEARRKNHTELWLDFTFHGLDEYFILPKDTLKSKPSPFGFCLTIRDGMPFTRLELVRFLEENQIGTRQLFGGNLIRHPAYKDVKYKVAGSLENSDKIMMDSFWFGVHPAITYIERDYILDKFVEFTRMHV